MKKLIFSFLIIASINPSLSYAQANTLEPIVLVPGIMGSWNWSVLLGRSTPDTWDFHSTDHTWDKLIDELIEEGYVLDNNLFIAFYDWRKSNEDSAINYLIPTIDRALANSSSTKVNIIAHSMGGLVSRSYIQSEDYINRNDVDQLVMLGTPNYGSSDVYTLWEGGEVPGNWSQSDKNGIKFILWFMTTFSANTSDYYDTIHTFITSIGELLPTYDFLSDSNDNVKPYSSLTEATNPFLENLNESESMQNLKELGRITVIAGTGTGTVGNISVVERPALETKLWADGIPEPINPIRNNPEGDNRVLLSSAFLNEFDLIGPVLSRSNQNFWQKIFAVLIPLVRAQSDEWDIDERLTQKEINSNHGGLPTMAIPEVFSALGLPNPVGDFEPPTEPNNITTFWFASPVAVKITDPQNRIITKDSNQIPEAIYTGENDPNGVKMIIIPDGLSGEYEVELIGTADGEYHMAVASFVDDNDNIVTVQKNVVEGEKIEYVVDVNHYENVPVKISAPIITKPDLEESSIIDLVNELLIDLEEYYKDGKINNKGIYQSLNNDLKFVLATLKEAELIRSIGKKYPKLHEFKLKLAEKLVIKKLESFILSVKKYNNKDKIDDPATSSMVIKAEAILAKINN
ncbi:MAG: PGAP1 family protein [Parcubacteria group bacterium GW2011_GWC1_39_8]|nr:MAG: PGAP1 family protein [Parcubacteria group bacterium GW2011_GWC1_39_8]